MNSRQRVRRKFRQDGMTLIEVLVSASMVGVMFLVLMTLLGQVGGFSAFFHGQASTIETVSEAISLLNGVVPQTTRITSCLCQADSSSRANCVWDSSNAWYDPVRNGGASSPVVVLAGEFEAFEGTQSLVSMAGLATSGISFPGATCQNQASDISSALLRGCRQTYSLVYTAPTQANGGTLSSAGQLQILLGESKSVTIGRADPLGANNLGLTELSCGFDNSSGGTTGSIFVLNLKVKTKSNLVQDSSHPRYESWHPSAMPNYSLGQFKEVRMKFAMRNISVRGIYSWKAQAIRNCKVNGQASTLAVECCSQALIGANCGACIRSGQAGSTQSCCSGQAMGGLCN